MQTMARPEEVSVLRIRPGSRVALRILKNLYPTIGPIQSVPGSTSEDSTKCANPYLSSK